MHAAAAALGLLLVVVVLWDTFETMVLPRTVTRRLRLTGLFYRTAWRVWRGAARRLSPHGGRESFLALFGPASLLLLIGLWALALIVGFALFLWGVGLRVAGPERHASFGSDLYLSGVTFFTLGYGDVTPRTTLGRWAAALEAGLGFGFLAMVIGYLPVLYQSFSRREVAISLLDARAGSPPTAGELLRRHAEAQQMPALCDLLREWERWASDLLESHLSYPVLAYYRSQHDRESWLAALAAVLDTCALVGAGFEGEAAWQRPLEWQARMTFAMARHAVVDMALILRVPPDDSPVDRLPGGEIAALRALTSAAGVVLRADEAADRGLRGARAEYEPYIGGLARHLLVALPPWQLRSAAPDNWQTSAWDHRRHF